MRPIRRIQWPLGLYRVAGHSMQPAYQPGDTVLGWRGWKGRPAARFIRPGRVVVACSPSGQLVIKRLAAADGPSALQLLGDNPADSLDSRHYGSLSITAIRAIVILKLP